MVRGAVSIIDKLVKHNTVQLEETLRMQSELRTCQASVIQLQEQVIYEKNVQLQKIMGAVSEKVGEVKAEVKEEFKGYSAALMSGVSGTGGETFSAADVKTAVRSALSDQADEQGREGNVVIFGIAEEEAGENLSEKVSKVFGTLNEKPKFSVKRLGLTKPSEGGRPRPVRVVLKTGAAAVQQILAKAVQLRETEEYKRVYISPDRTPEQRAAQRGLVGEVKRRRAEEPGKTHFKRGGVVISVEGK